MFMFWVNKAGGKLSTVFSEYKSHLFTLTVKSWIKAGLISV